MNALNPADLDAAVQANSVHIFIDTAVDVHQLTYLRKVKLPQMKFLPEAVRTALDEAAAQRVIAALDSLGARRAALVVRAG